MNLRQGTMKSESSKILPEPDLPQWKLIQTYASFGREDLAIGLVNDILQSTDRRRASDRAVALESLQILLVHLIREQVRFLELPPYIDDLIQLLRASRAKVAITSGLIGLIEAIIDDTSETMALEDRRFLERFVLQAPAVDGTELIPLAQAKARGSVDLEERAAAVIARVDRLTSRRPSARTVLKAESILRNVEETLRSSDVIDTDPCRTLMSEQNRIQLGRLLQFSLYRTALPRAIRLYRSPSTLQLFKDQLDGAYLYLRLTRRLLSDAD